MPAYYNEHDPKAAAWLRALIQAGLIADGEVDERSITDVQPGELAGFTQCHFFAGIGGWSYALRLAGWPDDRAVWTGSCPCQPFSSAGAQAGGDDARHLWPSWFRLIRECRPHVVFGEQVESAIAHGWIDLVCDDLEREGYAAGACGLPAASVGAPHIRQRLWFVAHANGWQSGDGDVQRGGRYVQRTEDAPASLGMADASGQRCHRERRRLQQWQPRQDRAEDGRDGEAGELGHHSGAGGGRHSGAVSSAQGEGASERIKHWNIADQSQPAGGVGSIGDCGMGESDREREAPLGGVSGRPIPECERSPWAAAEWIPCRDSRSRPVEPGTFPLAHGVSGRMVVRRAIQQAGSTVQEEHWYSRTAALRGYGNAIVPAVAAEFIGAYMDINA